MSNNVLLHGIQVEQVRRNEPFWRVICRCGHRTLELRATAWLYALNQAVIDHKWGRRESDGRFRCDICCGQDETPDARTEPEKPSVITD